MVFCQGRAAHNSTFVQEKNVKDIDRYKMLQQAVIDFLPGVETKNLSKDGIASGSWVHARLESLREKLSVTSADCVAVEVERAKGVSIGVMPEKPWDRPMAPPVVHSQFCLDKKINDFMAGMPEDWNGRFFFLMVVQMVDTFIKKNTDYAGTEGQKADMLANFREAEDLDVTMLKGILVRAGDKWKRIKNLTKEARAGMVADETVVDTMLDLANYMLIAIVAHMTTQTKEDI